MVKMGKLIVGLTVLLAFVGLLYAVSTGLSGGALTAWAIVATLLILPAFVCGAIVGNLEARGKISGIDLAMDKLGRTYEHASKTQADIEAKRKPPPAPTVQIMNGMPDRRLLPPISHRRPEVDEVIDL
jgi:hypothetical protein